VRAGDITSWRRQVPLKLEVNGRLICKHVIGFELTRNDGSLEYLEKKGFATPVYKLKRKLLEALLGYQVHRRMMWTVLQPGETVIFNEDGSEQTAVNAAPVNLPSGDARTS
jgi:hypothetical protein